MVDGDGDDDDDIITVNPSQLKDRVTWSARQKALGLRGCVAS